MTTRIPISAFSPQRRSLLIGGVSVAALGTVGSGSATASSSSDAQDIGFDFDTDNYIEFFQPTDENAGVSPSAAVFAPMDATIFLWVNHLTSIAWFDAVAPYHETAVGVYTRIRRRPSSESATNRNMNIALIHATYQVAKVVVAEKIPDIRHLMTTLGLNPDDESEDPTSPVGIGNLAGKGVIAARKHDGFNMLGDEGGRKYNRRPYEDYTGYRPVNSPFELKNPSRWQPQVTPHRRRLGAGPGDKGIYTIQTFAHPHIGRVKPYTYKDTDEFSIAPPDHTDHTNRAAYKRSVDEVLEASAALTDRQKVIAEVFDNKVWGVGHSTIVIARRHNEELGVHGWAHFFLAHILATFEVTMAAWHQKVKYDSVRPVSAIRHVYGSNKVTAWGGVGKGTVNDLPANEWTSYLNVGDHAEYPSGSTTICAAEAQTARRFFGNDVLDWRFTVPAGETLVEPGISPAQDVELYWATWTDFVQECAYSRLWGGVHFRKTIDRSIVFGEEFGDRAHEFVQRHMDGNVD